jgi:hypothetical protein
MLIVYSIIYILPRPSKLAALQLAEQRTEMMVACLAERIHPPKSDQRLIGAYRQLLLAAFNLDGKNTTGAPSVEKLAQKLNAEKNPLEWERLLIRHMYYYHKILGLFQGRIENAQNRPSGGWLVEEKLVWVYTPTLIE